MSADPVGGPHPAAAVSGSVARPRLWVLAGAPLLALAAAAGAGTLVGYVVVTVRMAGRNDQWTSLGAFIWGMLVGTVVAVVVYVAALIVSARRSFPPGRRAAPVLLTLSAHATVVGIVAVLTSRLQPTSVAGEVAGALMLLAFGACGPATFIGYGSTGRPRLTAVLVLSALTLSIVLVTGISYLAR